MIALKLNHTLLKKLTLKLNFLITGEKPTTRKINDAKNLCQFAMAKSVKSQKPCKQSCPNSDVMVVWK